MPDPMVLLTSVCVPFRNTHEPNSIMAELFQASVTRAQGPWSPRVVNHQWGLDVLAENIRAPTVVLHYPTEEDLIRELKRYRFAVVGISFNLCTYPEMLRTAALIRRFAPKATLVLGGYGTALPDELLRQTADLFCRGDGIPFMQDLLGEPRRPHVAPIITHTTRLLGMKVSDGGVICAGLGCPRGCDFCMTSHFHKQRYIPFLETGRDIFEVILRTRRIFPHITDFSIIDEDFLVDELRAHQLRDQIRASQLPLSLSIFASAQSLNHYSPMDLAEMGVDGIWIGVESPRAVLPKLHDVHLPTLFADLHSHGIAILASLMLGFEHHTEAVIRQELQDMIELRPVMSQFLVRGPALCTPLYRQMKEEGRLLPWAADPLHMDGKKADGFSLAFKHPHISPRDMERIQLACYDEEYRRLGPSAIRAVDAWFQGYKRFKQSKRPILRAKAEKFAREITKAFPLLRLAIDTAPSLEVRDRFNALRREIQLELGSSMESSLLETAVPWAERWTRFCLEREILQAPPLLRRTWRVKEPPTGLARLSPQLSRALGSLIRTLPRPVG